MPSFERPRRPEQRSRTLRALGLATAMELGACADLPDQTLASYTYPAQPPARGQEAMREYGQREPSVTDILTSLEAWENTRWRTTLYERGPDGRLRVNWWILLSPVQVEIPQAYRQAAEVNFRVPYEYARQFENDPRSRDPRDPKAASRLARYVDQQIQRQMGEVLVALDMNQRVHASYENEDAAPSRIPFQTRSLRVTGYASPEGPEQRGPRTLEIGAIDPENISLAGTRAKAGEEAVTQSFRRRGIGVESAQEELRAEETQFTDAELVELHQLAEQAGLRGATKMEQIFEVVLEYNNGRLKDPRIVTPLARILDSKRAIQIKAGLEGQRTKTLIIPIPLLLLLGAGLPHLLRALRRRRNQLPEPAPEPQECPTHPWRREPFSTNRDADNKPTPQYTFPTSTYRPTPFSPYPEGTQPTTGRYAPEMPVKPPVIPLPPEQIPDLVHATQLPVKGTPEYEQIHY